MSSRVPKVVLRCSRLQLFIGLAWGAQGIMELASPDPSRWFPYFGIGLSVLWVAMHLTSSITVTESLVIVQRGLLQDIYKTQTFIDHEIERAGRWDGGHYTLDGEKLRIPFLIRPALILESIMRVKGIDSPSADREYFFRGRERGLL